MVWPCRQAGLEWCAAGVLKWSNAYLDGCKRELGLTFLVSHDVMREFVNLALSCYAPRRQRFRAKR